jgi:hypothetical protein
VDRSPPLVKVNPRPEGEVAYELLEEEDFIPADEIVLELDEDYLEPDPASKYLELDLPVHLLG